MPYSAHSSIRAVKRAGHDPSIHGTKLWKSSCLIIDYLKKHPRSAEVKSWTRLRLGYHRYLVCETLGCKRHLNGCGSSRVSLP